MQPRFHNNICSVHILIIILTVLLTGCKKDNVVDIQPVKDPRTYTWTADTLGYPGAYQTLMSNIWGSSHNDVFVVGHSSMGGSGSMWQYDGKSWSNVRLTTAEGGYVEGGLDLTSIYGFSSTDIYAAGERIFGFNPNPPPTLIDSSLIIHFDGSTWKRVSIYNGTPLNDIYGSSANDIWAGGLGNNLFHYNGNRWEADSIIVNIPNGFIFQIGSISSYKSFSYLIGISNNNTTAENIFYLFKRVNNSWVMQDSSIVYANGSFSGNKFGERLNKCSLPDLYSTGQGGIYKYNNSSWININAPNPIFFIWGTSNNNIFAIGFRGKVYHYNGTDWKQIEQLYNSDINYYGVWTDGTEAFVVGQIFDGTYQKTIVWHGK
jgi:hypothetical protein